MQVNPSHPPYQIQQSSERIEAMKDSAFGGGITTALFYLAGFTTMGGFFLAASVAGVIYTATRTDDQFNKTEYGNQLLCGGLGNLSGAALTSAIGPGIISGAGQAVATHTASSVANGREVTLAGIATAATVGSVTGGVGNQLNQSIGTVVGPVQIVAKAGVIGGTTAISGQATSNLLEGRPVLENLVQSGAIGTAVGVVSALPEALKTPDPKYENHEQEVRKLDAKREELSTEAAALCAEHSKLVADMKTYADAEKNLANAIKKLEDKGYHWRAKEQTQDFKTMRDQNFSGKDLNFSKQHHGVQTISGQNLSNPEPHRLDYNARALDCQDRIQILNEQVSVAQIQAQVLNEQMLVQSRDAQVLITEQTLNAVIPFLQATPRIQQLQQTAQTLATPLSVTQPVVVPAAIVIQEAPLAVVPAAADELDALRENREAIGRQIIFLEQRIAYVPANNERVINHVLEVQIAALRGRFAYLGERIAQANS